MIQIPCLNLEREISVLENSLGVITKPVQIMGKKVKNDNPVTVEDAVLVPEQMEPLNDRDLLLKPVNSWRTYIRRLLNEDGSYKRKYTYPVALAAQSMKLLQECYLEIMRLPEGQRFSLEEISREGNARKVSNPMVLTYIRIDAMCRNNLRALGLNMDNLIGGQSQGESDDPLANLMKALKQ